MQKSQGISHFAPRKTLQNMTKPDTDFKTPENCGVRVPAHERET